MAHALVRGDVRMLDDPLRAQSLSLAAGCILAVIVVAGSAILAFLRPQGGLGSAPIVMVRDSGALYVRIGDTMHPVLNLASARLIAGTPANPEPVSESAINDAKRGPLVGIPGAPATVASPLVSDESAWTVCDDASGTTVVAGDAWDDADGLDAGHNLLVAPRSESAATTYLVYGGWRAKVDLRNHAVVRALRIDGVVPQPVSRATLDAIPEAPPIIAPHIPGAGSPGPPSLRGLTVGAVVRVARAGSVEYYVVLADGVQRVGEVAADLIRFTHSQRHREIVTVAPDVIGAVPIVDALGGATLPERGGVVSEPVVCAHWRPGPADGETNTTVLVGNSLPLGGGNAPVKLAQADGHGSNVDSVSMPHGRSAYVRAIGITGDDESAGVLYFINESGVAFGLRDEDAAKHLGLTTSPVPAPWPVLARLPRGPVLDKDSASIARDSIVAPS